MEDPNELQAQDSCGSGSAWSCPPSPSSTSSDSENCSIDICNGIPKEIKIKFNYEDDDIIIWIQNVILCIDLQNISKSDDEQQPYIELAGKSSTPLSEEITGEIKNIYRTLFQGIEYIKYIDEQGNEYIKYIDEQGNEYIKYIDEQGNEEEATDARDHKKKVRDFLLCLNNSGNKGQIILKKTKGDVKYNITIQQSNKNAKGIYFTVKYPEGGSDGVKEISSFSKYYKKILSQFRNIEFRNIESNVFEDVLQSIIVLWKIHCPVGYFKEKLTIEKLQGIKKNLKLKVDNIDSIDSIDPITINTERDKYCSLIFPELVPSTYDSSRTNTSVDVDHPIKTLINGILEDDPTTGLSFLNNITTGVIGGGVIEQYLGDKGIEGTGRGVSDAVKSFQNIGRSCIISLLTDSSNKIKTNQNFQGLDHKKIIALDIKKLIYILYGDHPLGHAETQLNSLITIDS